MLKQTIRSEIVCLCSASHVFVQYSGAVTLKSCSSPLCGLKALGSSSNTAASVMLTPVQTALYRALPLSLSLRSLSSQFRPNYGSFSRARDSFLHRELSSHCSPKGVREEKHGIQGGKLTGESLVDI